MYNKPTQSAWVQKSWIVAMVPFLCPVCHNFYYRLHVCQLHAGRLSGCDQEYSVPNTTWIKLIKCNIFVRIVKEKPVMAENSFFGQVDRQPQNNQHNCFSASWLPGDGIITTWCYLVMMSSPELANRSCHKQTLPPAATWSNWMERFTRGNGDGEEETLIHP